MSGDTWAPGTFWIAMPNGPDTRSGYVLGGLGLAHDGWAKPSERTHWTLTHIGSGAAICRLAGTVAAVMPVAAEIARCGDWTLFDLPNGWKQTDPKLLLKLVAVLDRHPGIARGPDRSGKVVTPDDARVVIAARDAAPNPARAVPAGGGR